MKTAIGFLVAIFFAAALHAGNTNQLANASSRTATNALPRAVELYQPKYELIRMTTDKLAERHAIIGWSIRRKK